jgi:3-hydroxyacyl-CoA dehydrogenase
MERGRSQISTLLDASVKKGRLSAAERDRRLAALETTLALDGLDSADLIVEAVFENMAIKRDIFGQLDRIARDGAVLATNTSTLDIDQIAAATRRPQDVVGLHFFSPAHVMRLIEIVRGRATSATVLGASLDFARRVNKVGVVVGNAFGFVGNRMYYAYGRENQFLMLEGAAPEAVDRALQEFGMAMGPNAVGDYGSTSVTGPVNCAIDRGSALVPFPRSSRNKLEQKTGRLTGTKPAPTPIPDPGSPLIRMKPRD